MTWTLLLIAFAPASWNPFADHVSRQVLAEHIATQEACEAAAAPIRQSAGIRTSVVCVPVQDGNPLR